MGQFKLIGANGAPLMVIEVIICFKIFSKYFRNILFTN
jgi:hypothetical protein